MEIRRRFRTPVPEAYAGLADSYLLLSGYGGTSQSEATAKARAAAQRALEIDERLAEAHTSLALIAENYDWNWAEADRQYKRAIELNPNYATAHHWYGECLALLGSFDEAIAEMKRAAELDPLSLIISTDMGELFFLARQYDKAIEQLRKVLEMDPNFTPAHFWLAFAYAQKGMDGEAIAETQKMRQLDDTAWTLMTYGYVHAVAGQRGEAQKALAELKQRVRREYIDPASIAAIYIGLGEKEEAFAWLEKEYEEHSIGLTSLKVNPIYDILRSDLRFTDLMRRVGFNP